MLRYIANGVFATGVHYAILTLNIKIVGLASVGLASFIAAFFGIAASFLGNRYFVFSHTKGGFLEQVLKFSGIYGIIAVIHGLLLWVWTDMYGFDYRKGFLLATSLQLLLSFAGNKWLVFKK
jgi:putative flippase GtrA